MIRRWLWGQFKILLSLAVYVTGGLTVFFTLTWIAAALAPAHRRSLDEAYLLALMLNLLSWFVALIVHESGHFFAAVSNEGHIVEIRISCFYLVRRRHGYRFQVKRPPSFLSGWVKQYPNPASDARRHMIVVLAAGAGANILFASLMGLLSFLSFENDGAVRAAIFGSLAWVNLFMAISNLAPSWKNANKDGSRLYRMMAHGISPSERALIKLSSESRSGTRVRDVAEVDIRSLAEDPAPSMRLLAGYFWMRRAMDNGDIAEASRIFSEQRTFYAALSSDIQKRLKDLWQFVVIEHCYLRARFDGDPTLARQELGRLGPNVPPFIRFRVEAAAAYAEGQFDKAGIALAKAREDVEDTCDTGTRIEELAMLDDLEASLVQ